MTETELKYIKYQFPKMEFKDIPNSLIIFWLKEYNKKTEKEKSILKVIL